MIRAKRKIVEIDEAKCNGCGQCIPNCREGALRIVDGKARLVGDVYCDGLGACLGHCPQDAIRIVEREAEAFDEAATGAHLKQMQAAHPAPPGHGQGGCPSARALSVTKKLRSAAQAGPRAARHSELMNWPVQLMLVPPAAPYLKGAHLLIAADCVGFAMPDFHGLLEGKILIIACPKLDDARIYTDKLAHIFAVNGVASVTVAHMEVPCCFGLKMIVEDAIAKSGKDVPLKDVTIAIEGAVK
ncbi:MAG: ATP-binding protein [Deltaproteobacteria bacterium]